jgi:hypothetical protein
MKRTLLLLAICVSLLSGCGSTARTSRLGITLDRRIGAVREGESKSNVDAALGHGAERRVNNRGTYVVYAQAKLRVGFYTDRGHQFAIEIDTRSPQYTTGSGIGVGSTLGQLRRRIDVTCDVADPTTCHHPSTISNDTSTGTVFKIDPGTKRVTEIDILPVAG